MNVSGAYNPIPDGQFAIENPMGPGTPALGSFAAWINNSSGNIASRGGIFLHNDLGSDGTEGCVGVELGGSGGERANKFVDLYDKIGPSSINVDLTSADGMKFTTGGGTGGSGGGGEGGGGLGGGGLLGFFSKIAEKVGGLDDLMAGFKAVGGIFGDALMALVGGGGSANAATTSGETGAAYLGGNALATEGDEKDKAILDMIASVEAAGDEYGGFNVSRGSTPGRAVDHSIQWLADNAQGAIGRYQHMPEFLADRAIAAGIPLDTKFTPEVQDKLTLDMMRRDGAHPKWKSGAMSDDEYGNYLSRVWRGLPHSSGGTYPDQFASGNAAGMSRGAMMEELQRIKKLQKGGVANMSGSGAYSNTMVKQSQEQFAEMIATKMAPQVVPVVVPGPGNGGEPSVSQGAQAAFPVLPAEDSSIVSMEYKYRITMGASV